MPPCSDAPWTEQGTRSSRALVLGGGGVVGIAWETGVLAGLVEGGVPLRDADLVLGTSAGAFVGAQFAAGEEPSALVERQLRLQAPPGLPRLPHVPLRMAGVSAKEVTTCRPIARAIGAFARAAGRCPEALWVEAIQDLLDFAEWPRAFACTGIDIRTGAFRVWRAEDGVDPVRAIAASCSMPGVFPPVTVDGERYMDGGLRTSTNADLAAGHDVVLVLSVMARGGLGALLGGRALRHEVATLEQAGSAVVTLTPDADAIGAMGPAMLATASRSAAAEAGYRQGRTEAERLGALWAERAA